MTIASHIRSTGSIIAAVLLMAASTAYGQATIRGKITDAANSEKLPSATVVVKGTSIGAAADLDGNYVIRSVPAGDYTIVASYLGYVTAEAIVSIPSDGGTIEKDFALTSTTIEGEEVIVTAQARGQMHAIQQQLASDKIASIVSEARIQELPDFNAAQAISRLPGVATLQSSGEANKVVIRGLAPQYNAVAIGGITLAATGGTQMGVSSLGNTAGRLNTDRSIDLTMITPYMIKTVEVFKSLTPDMNANAIGGYVNMNVREAPDGLKTDLLVQGGYTQKSGDYGNYRVVAAGSDRFFDDLLGIYVLGNAEKYDRDADNMNANYNITDFNLPPSGKRPVQVNSVELNRHAEIRNRYGANLILDYRLPSGTIKSVNVFSRLRSDATDYRTILNYLSRDISFRVRKGITNTDLAMNSLEFTNNFGWFDVELKAANSYSRNSAPGSPQFDFTATGDISSGVQLNMVPESLVTNVNFQGAGQTLLTNISMFSADFLANDQDYKADVKVPFNLGDITSGYLKIGGEFRHSLRTNEQGTPYGGLRAGSPINDEMLRLIEVQYPWLQRDAANSSYPASNFTSRDPALIQNFLDDRFGRLLWASETGDLLGITDLISHNSTINAVNSSGTNAGGWYDGPYQHLPNQYEYNERYYASYLMGEVNVGPAIKVVGGVRWEEVKATYDAYNLADGRDPNTQIVDSVFAHPWNRYVLPMVQTKWNPFEWLDLRYSYTQTLARPDYHQLSPHFSMNVTRFEVWSGNPSLKPAEAANHDLFLTIHGNELGLLSVGAFYKEVEHFTFQTRYPLHLTSPSGLDSIGSYQVRSSQGGTVGTVGPNDGAFLNTYSNSQDPAFIRGFEVDFQTRFWYLPEPFNGMVFGANYTRVSSKATYPFRYDTTIQIPATPRPILRVITLDKTREGRLINQPNDVVNVYVGYDYGGFSGRVSFLYQGNSVSFIGKAPEEDGFTRDYFRVDVSARQKLPWFGLQVFLDVFNTNARRNESAQNSLNGFTSQQNYGMTANLGLRYTM